MSDLCRELRYPSDVARGTPAWRKCVEAAEAIERMESVLQEIAAYRGTPGKSDFRAMQAKARAAIEHSSQEHSKEKP